MVPALKQPDLSPLEISARTTSRAAFPPATAAARTMAVPMRTVDQIKYAKTLPDPFHLGVAGRCRLYLLTCGAVFSEVARPFLDTDALQRGVEKADINDGVKLLPRTQPSLEAARYGVTIEARPGAVREGKPRPFGYDVQVRQSGRLVARVRVAGPLRRAPAGAGPGRAVPDRQAERRAALTLVRRYELVFVSWSGSGWRSGWRPGRRSRRSRARSGAIRPPCRTGPASTA